MHRRKYYLIGFFVLLTFQIGIVRAQADGLNIEASDKAWNNLPKLPGWGTTKITPANRAEVYIDFLKRKEIISREFRKAGLCFWRDYPNDSRRYLWLLLAVTNRPQYWEDIDLGAKEQFAGTKYTGSINKAELSDWNEVYPLLEKAFMSSFFVSDSARMILEKTYMWWNIQELHELVEFMKGSMLPNRKSLIKETQKLVQDSLLSFITKYFKVYNNENIFHSPTSPLVPAYFIGNSISYRYHDYGFHSLGELSEFLSPFATTIDTLVNAEARGIMNLIELQQTPISIKYKTIDGSNIDLANLRGKTILLDIWSTGCNSCIENMSSIKEIYQKYHREGFEVISICINEEKDIERVKKIESNVNIAWPLLLVGGTNETENDKVTGHFGGLTKQLWQQYGFLCVPQLLLLDKNGLLVEYGDALSGSGLEPIVKKNLGIK